MNLEKNKALFETLYNNSATGIIIVNEAGKISSVNLFLLELFGYKLNELVGQTIEILIPKRYHSSHIKSRINFTQNPQTRPMGMGIDLKAIKSNGEEFPVEISLTHCEIDTNKFIIGFVHDISIRKKGEEEIIKLNEDLEKKVNARTKELNQAIEELEKSKTELALLLKKEKEISKLKSRFVSMAAHEFRTPLSTILSSIYLIENYTLSEENDKRKKHIDRIVSSVSIMTETLNEFLSVGKIEEGKIITKIAKFKLKDIVLDVIQSMNHSLKQGQIISYHHIGTKIASLDSSLFKHILQNLISNAIKFSPDNSKIEINSEINLDHIILKVKDYGLGISKADQKHLKERFFRSENVLNIEGTGLGLHIVSKYTELLKGTMECISELEKGSEFIIKFKLKK